MALNDANEEGQFAPLLLDSSDSPSYSSLFVLVTSDWAKTLDRQRMAQNYSKICSLHDMDA